MKLQDILERIKAYIKQKENKDYVYDKDISNVLNVTIQSLSRMKKVNSIPYQKIIEFCEKEGISTDWILFGKYTDCDENKLKIKYRYNVRASAGGGAENLDEDFLEITIDENIAKALNLNKEDEKYIEAINVVGDSMSPVIEDGAIAYIDLRKTDISKSGIYAVSTNNSGLFIKRVVLDPITNKIELISENKYYNKITVEPNEIKIIGRVIGVTSRVF
jgi:phage repressor protein C with HTH and peptisase S24 domain